MMKADIIFALALYINIGIGVYMALAFTSISDPLVSVVPEPKGFFKFTLGVFIWPIALALTWYYTKLNRKQLEIDNLNDVDDML